MNNDLGKYLQIAFVLQSRHRRVDHHPRHLNIPMPALTALNNEKSRADLINRLKRAEGQLRGIQRMIEEGEPCLDIATQMAAVRKALDSTSVRLTMSFIEQQLEQPADPQTQERPDLSQVLAQVESLLNKGR